MSVSLSPSLSDVDPTVRHENGSNLQSSQPLGCAIRVVPGREGTVVPLARTRTPQQDGEPYNHDQSHDCINRLAPGHKGLSGPSTRPQPIKLENVPSLADGNKSGSSPSIVLDVSNQEATFINTSIHNIPLPYHTICHIATHTSIP